MGQEPAGLGRLTIVGIHSIPRNPPLLQPFQDGGVIHQAAPRGVDEVRPFLMRAMAARSIRGGSPGAWGQCRETASEEESTSSSVAKRNRGEGLKAVSGYAS